MWGGVSPPHRGSGLGRGLCPLPGIFLILALTMAGFGAFWVVFFKVELFVQNCSVLRLPKLAIARCICPSPVFLVFQNGVLLQFKAQVYETCLGIFEA